MRILAETGRFLAIRRVLMPHWYYNGVPPAGYIVTPGPGYGPERSYAYPSAQIYRSTRVVRPRHAVRHHRAMKRRVVEYRR